MEVVQNKYLPGISDQIRKQWNMGEELDTVQQFTFKKEIETLVSSNNITTVRLR